MINIFKRSISCFLVVIFFSFPSFAQEESNEPTIEKGFDSLQKSLLIPGWGQLAEKKYLEGVLLLSAEIFCLYKLLANNQKGNENYRFYKAAENVDDAVIYRDLTEEYDKRRNVFILAAAGVWAVNLIDIYVIVKSKKKKNKNLKIQLESSEKKMLGFTITFRF